MDWISIILSIAAGLLLLFAGRRFFWLIAALVAFLFVFNLFEALFGGGRLGLFAAVAVGVVFAWLATKFIKIVGYIVGALAGAVGLPLFLNLFGLNFSWLLMALIGAVVGFLLMMFLFDWGLIFVYTECMQFRKSPPITTYNRIRVGCPAHNCGGRCLLVAHVYDGRIVRLEADDRPDSLAAPQLRACGRGRTYLRRQYHPDRLTRPLQRTGPRGSGKFRPISWEAALDRLASEMERIRHQYGPSALFVPYGTGSYNQLNGSHVARRLMNLYGGCLGIYNSYSWGATNLATPTMYGTLVTGNQRQDWS